jgi:beta-alanine degradation protein BauB
MKNLFLIMISLVLTAFALIFVTETVMAEEGTAAMSQGVQMLLENERVKVTEALRHPGEKEEMHTHPAYVAYFFGPCKVKQTFPDGKIVEKEFKAKQVQWSNGVTHAVEVIGTNDQHVLLIELKK